MRSNYSYGETLYPRTYMGWSELRAMRTDGWKLILAPHPELYDLQRDPGELQNLIAHHPAEADQLQKKIWEVAGTHGQDGESHGRAVDEQTRQELESLGYVSGGSTREIQLGTDAPDPKDRIAVLKTMQEAEKLPERATTMRVPRSSWSRRFARTPAIPWPTSTWPWRWSAPDSRNAPSRFIRTRSTRHIFTDLIYARLGKLYLRLHELDKAVDAMNRADQINPTDLDNLRNLGTAQLQLGHVDEAEKAFKAITLQNDHYSAAYNGLGLVAIQRGDNDGGAARFRESH